MFTGERSFDIRPLNIKNGIFTGGKLIMTFETSNENRLWFSWNVKKLFIKPLKLRAFCITKA